MIQADRFSYACNQCGLCCRDKVITLSPYDVTRIARAAGISTGELIRKYSMRRGSVLRFKESGECVALEGTRCSVHQGRPLACRLYPLGLQRDKDGSESYVRLEAAPGSLGVYGDEGTVADFLVTQGVDEYLAANERYRALLPILRERVAAVVDFERVEPREFWRVATREALAETNYDPNPLIDALFAADQHDTGSIERHLEVLETLVRAETNAATLAAAAILLAVSLGYTPADVTGGHKG